MKIKNLIAAVMLIVFSACAAAPARAASTVRAETAQQKELAIPYVKIEGGIDFDIAAQMVGTFDAIARMEVPVVLVEINSPGGIVDAGFLISKAIEDSPVPVICVVDGMAASMAAYILQSCDVRIMTDRSVLMFHEPSIGGSFSGKADDWKKVGKEIGALLEALTKALNHHMARRMLISYEEFSARIHNTDWWLDSLEALQVGAVDGVVDSVRTVQLQILEGLR